MRQRAARTSDDAKAMAGASRERRGMFSNWAPRDEVDERMQRDGWKPCRTWLKVRRQKRGGPTLPDNGVPRECGLQNPTRARCSVSSRSADLADLRRLGDVRMVAT